MSDLASWKNYEAFCEKLNEWTDFDLITFSMDDREKKRHQHNLPIVKQKEMLLTYLRLVVVDMFF